MLKATERTIKRPDYIGWDEYFMAVAMLSAQRSKDPRCAWPIASPAHLTTCFV
jgi:hypothetical protein